jgi:hypothetical protein
MLPSPTTPTVPLLRRAICFAICFAPSHWTVHPL